MHKFAVEALSMSNAKVLMPNEIQIVNVKTRIPKEDLKFDIDLTFACLREAASAKAGILTFELILIVFLSPLYPLVPA